MGILNIIITKLKAELMARSGTWRVVTVVDNLRDATAQSGSMTVNPAAQVTGPKYPSGICIESPSKK